MNRRKFWTSLILILVSFGLGFFFYPSMPATVASHWGIDGQANGYSPKLFGLFLLPVLSAVLFVLLTIIPRIDPLKNNVAKFGKHYEDFILVILGFFTLLQIFIILWNLGIKIPAGLFMAPLFSIIFYFAGVLIEKSERNYFIGIRTPWTLASDLVWKETARVGGKLFKVCGGLCLVGLLIPSLIFYFVIVPVLLASIFTFIYSYLVFRRLGL